MFREGRTGKFLQDTAKRVDILGSREVAMLLAVSLLLAAALPALGDHSMMLRAYAASDTIKPLVVIEQPSSGSKATAGTIKVSGTAVDNKGGSGVKAVEVSLDGASYRIASPAASGDWTTWSISINISEPGSHKITARGTDRAGNKDWHSVTISIATIALSGGGTDDTDPKVVITNPADNTAIKGTSITVSGIASDIGGSGVKLIETTLDGNSKAYKPATPKGTGDWSTWSVAVSMTSGSHRLTARATDNAGNQKWDSIVVTAGSSTSGTGTGTGADKDRFGVKIIYPTKTGGREWFAKWDNGNPRTMTAARSDPSDPMFEVRGSGSTKVVIDGQGMASMSGSQPRMYVNQLAQKWQPNLEITVYMKRMTDASTAWGGSVLSWGNHRDESSNGNCGVDTYYSRVRHDGNLDIEKEVDHPASNVFSGAVKKWSALPHDEWIGHKFILKKMSNGDMKLEKWLDENANQNWVKVQEVTDSGMTGVRASGCTDDLSRVLNAPQESVFIRNTDITLAQYKWFSIREIAAVP